jgi:4-hydroxythreonine-4-phosphate dehydrogenase
MKKRFIFSCGDINGIGPEIVIKAINRLAGRRGYQFIFICPANVFNDTATRIKPGFEYRITKKIEESDQPGIILFDTGAFKPTTGKPTKNSGKAAYHSLEIAANYLKRNLADALITAPISKEALNAAGYRYPGHTEMLAEWFDTDRFVMMFLSRKLKTALATIHKPISEVPGLITLSKLESVTDVIIESLKKDFNISTPGVGILGLNPHAGESGLIGDEEEKILLPFLKSYRYRRYLHGPFSSDAYWGNETYKKYDLTLGMYHDQVLIPFKLLNFSKGVNFTAGLPIVRTSPDHGVAYDIAGKNRANEASLMEAFYFADQILKNRKR